jgi:hypothetical protein
MSSLFDKDVDWIKAERLRQRRIDALHDRIRRNAEYDAIFANERQSNASGERVLLAIYALYAIALWWLS